MHRKYRTWSLLILALFFSNYSLQAQPSDEDIGSIKEYKATDKESLINLCVQNKNMLFRAFKNNNSIDDDIKQSISSDLENSDYHTKVIRQDGNVAAFILYKFYDEEDFYISAGGHIEVLAVDQQYRRNGYATSLLNKAIHDIKQTVGGPYRLFPLRVSVYVQKNNTIAQGLYEKLGFSYKGDSSDSINMLYTKKLATRWWFITQYPKLSLTIFYGLIAGLYWKLKSV